MTVAERAKQILDLTELNLPKSPRIVGVDVEEFVHHDGDNAPWVYALLAPEEKDSENTGEAVLKIKKEVRQKQFQEKLGTSPYVRFLSADELNSIGAS